MVQTPSQPGSAWLWPHWLPAAGVSKPSVATPELMLHILTGAHTVGHPQGNPSLGILVLQSELKKQLRVSAGE